MIVSTPWKNNWYSDKWIIAHTWSSSPIESESVISPSSSSSSTADMIRQLVFDNKCSLEAIPLKTLRTYDRPLSIRKDLSCLQREKALHLDLSFLWFLVGFGAGSGEGRREERAEKNVREREEGGAEREGVSRCGLAVKRYAGKQKDLCSIRFGSPFS